MNIVLNQQKKIRNSFLTILGPLVADNREIWKAFAYLLMIAVICYFSALVFFSISIDSEYAALRTDHTVWASQGRWTAYLITQYLFPQTTIPFLPSAFFVVSITISYILIQISHGLKVNWKTYALFPFFCAFPTWSSLTEFSANMPSASAGILLTSIASYLYSFFIVQDIILEKFNFKNSKIIMIAFFVAAAIGAYQSYILLFFCCGIGSILLLNIYDTNTNTKKLLKMICVLMVVSVTSLICYAIINQIFLFTLNLKITYIDGFYHPEIFLNDPLKVITQTVYFAKKMYLGNPSLYGISINSVGILVLLGFISILTPQKITMSINKIIYLFILFVVLITPFSLGLMTGREMQDLRTLVALPYVVWLFSVIATNNRIFIFKILSFFAVFLGIFQILYLSSLCAANKFILQNHDRILANTIYERIVTQHSDFDRNKIYYVDYFGAISFKTPYPAPFSSTVNASFFNWDNGNPSRINDFMNLLGYNNLGILGKEKRIELIPHYQDMPLWPALGSVKVVNGIILIKLGNTKGSY